MSRLTETDSISVSSPLLVPFTIHVGPELLYEVRVIIGPLYDDNGDTAASMIDHDDRLILIDLRTPMHALPLVAAAAVSVAWREVTADGTT